ncbi:MAG TPA: hypothetical protein VGD94_20185 [Vicinamibacterales bacterium]
MNRLIDSVRTIFQPRAARQRKLAASRPPLTRDEFVAATVARGGDAEAAGFIWSHLEAWGLESGFSPHPDDDLDSSYGIAEEERDEDLVGNLLASLSVPLPTSDRLREFEPVDTLLDVARLAHQLRAMR